MPESRSSGTATVLFTDLVGSTELMAQLGDAVFDDLRGEHFIRLREAVSACRGLEIKTTGDGMLATFTSAVDALAAAVAVQQATDRHARSAGVALFLRVGLALGEVAMDDGDVFGTPVVEAARLVAVARPGQILCTALVRAVAGSRAGVAFTDVGALELKGLPEPVAACHVEWEPLAEAASSAVPLPTILTGAGRVFVGRDGELERLRQLAKEAAVGERRLALLGGEPGIGKTRLAAELAGALRAEGVLVLAGRCDEDLGVPYQPFVESLRHYVAHAAEPHLGRHGGELTRLVPELAQLLPGLPEPMRSDPETERYRLFDGVAAWLADVSAEAPVLLVLDDLHWAAKPTVLLLRHVLRSSEPLRLLVVATYRDTDIGRGHPLTELLGDVRRIEGAARLALTGLDRPGVAAFLEQAAGHELDEEGEDLARVVWAETEGNPFFLTEVLRHLSESGALEQRDGRWVVTADVEDLGIPEGVRDVVGRRLSRLSEEANRILACASVAGLEFEPAVVQTAGGFSEEAVLSTLDEAVATRLVVEVPGPVPRNRFAHALVRATLYDELTAARRVALHRHVAEALESLHAGDLDDHLPALAHHWARASAPAANTARAVDYATRAGDRALAQLANDEAATYYGQALDLLAVAGVSADTAQRLELLIALGEAQRRAGDPRHRETLLDAARLAQARGDATALARAALANKRGIWASAVGAVDADRIAILETALEAVGPEDSTTRARVLAALGDEVIYLGDRMRRVALSDEALSLARRLGDPATLAEVLLLRQSTVMDPDTVSERLGGTAEILALAERVQDPVLASRALIFRVRVAREAGDFEEAERSLESAERLIEELGQPTLRWLATANRMSGLAFAGELEAADGYVTTAAELAEASGQPDALLWLAWGGFQVRFEQGRLDEVDDIVRDAAGRNPEVPALQAMLALCYYELGRLEEARPLFDGLAAHRFSHPVDNIWMRSLTDSAAVCASLGDLGAAHRLRELLAPYGDQVVATAPAISGSVSHYLGLLATGLEDFDEAEDRFAAAAATHERIGALPWLARTRLEWARMLVQRADPGDAARARELLDQALVTAVDLGLGNVERHARALLETTEPG